MLRIALPNKGRLNQDCRDLLNDAGLEVRASSERALTASLGGEFEAIFVRARTFPSSSPTAPRMPALPDGTWSPNPNGRSNRASISSSDGVGWSLPPAKREESAR